MREIDGHIADARRAIGCALEVLQDHPGKAGAVPDALAMAQSVLGFFGRSNVGRLDDCVERRFSLWAVYKVLDDRDWESFSHTICCLTDGYKRAAEQSHGPEATR